MAKKYVSLDTLRTFLDNLSNKFANLTHSHTISDISDFTLDSSLSPNSVNPVQNRVLDAEFEAISEALNVYDTALDDKANATHTHAISDVSGLQSALDGKAAASHGTHVSFDSTNKPKMDGTAAFGTSTKVARADHVHPTDTSRASQVDLDALETVVAGKANASHTHAISDVTNLQSLLDEINNTIEQKSQVQIITWEDND